MATPLQEFLVNLGFNVDQESLRKFHESVGTTHKLVRDFAIAVGTMATAIEESIRRTARQFETLFYLSQQTGVAVRNIREWQFAFQQVGLSAGDLNSTLVGIATSLRDNPGLRGLANNIAPGFKNAQDVLEGFARQYRALMDRFGEDTPQLNVAAIGLRRMAEMFGISAESLRQLAVNYREVVAAREQYNKSVAAFGFTNQQDASKAAAELLRSFNRIWTDLDLASERFITDTFPVVNQLLRDLANWLETEGAAKIRVWAKAFEDWLGNRDNIEDVRRKFVSIGQAAITIANGISTLIGLFKDLSDTVGPINAIVITLFATIVARAALAAAAVWAVRSAVMGLGVAWTGLSSLWGATGAAAGAGAGAAGTSAGLLSRLGGLFGGATAAGAATLFIPDRMLGPQAQEIRRNAFQSLLGGIANALRTPNNGRPAGQPGGAPDTVLPTPGAPAAPGGKKMAYEEGGGGDESFTTAELLLRGFSSWWSGSSAFRPIVSLADDTYGKLRDMLIGLLGLGGNAGGIGGASGPPPVAGEGTLSPGSGPRGAAGHDPGGVGFGEGDVVPPGSMSTRRPAGGWATGSAPAHQAEHGGFNFAGIRAARGFRTYPSEFAGVADAGDLLRSYGRRGFDTLEKIINRWAPPSENNTSLLLKRAQEWSGFKLDQKLNLEDPGTLAKVLGVMNRNEFGGRETVPAARVEEYTKRLLGGERPAGDRPQSSEAGGPDRPPPGGGEPLQQGISGRFSGGRVDLSKINKTLVETLSDASSFLPEGYSLQATSGARTGGLADSQHRGGQALDVEIMGPNGKPLRNRGADTSGMYRRLAHAWYNVVSQYHPELANRAAWGGEFETAPGSGVPDLMHFDFGGRRGRFQRNDWRYIDSPHTTNINVHTNTDDPHGHARVLGDVTKRESALHIRNLRNAMA